MSRPVRRLLSAVATLACATAAHAQGETTRSPWSFGASAAAATFGDADLDGGGRVQLQSVGVSLSLAYGPNPSTSLGVGLSTTEHRFSFDGAGDIASLAPWSDVDLTTLSLPLRFAVDRQWSVSVVPSYQLAREQDAGSDDAQRYGGIVALSYAVSPRQFVGLGASYFTGLDDDTAFPILLVDWQFDERWRLTNPLQAGPTGPAGLELVHRWNERWEAGIGGAYRSLRFRLADDNAAAPGGTGQYSAFIGFARVQYRFNPELTLAVYAGGDFNGEIEVNAKGGRTLQSQDVGSSPMLAVSLSGRF